VNVNKLRSFNEHFNTLYGKGFLSQRGLGCLSPPAIPENEPPAAVAGAKDRIVALVMNGKRPQGTYHPSRRKPPAKMSVSEAV
jgi:hypothetical protein